MAPRRHGGGQGLRNVADGNILDPSPAAASRHPIRSQERDPGHRAAGVGQDNVIMNPPIAVAGDDRRGPAEQTGVKCAAACWSAVNRSAQMNLPGNSSGGRWAVERRHLGRAQGDGEQAREEQCQHLHPSTDPFVVRRFGQNSRREQFNGLGRSGSSSSRDEGVPGRRISAKAASSGSASSWRAANARSKAAVSAAKLTACSGRSVAWGCGGPKLG